jgi:DUF1680 family protein
MGTEGTTYLYNNPLTCQGGVTRKTWYAVPCCPSNISRTWADLGNYVYSSCDGELRIHQYMSNEIKNQTIGLYDGSEVKISLKMNSEFPYEGKAQLKITDLSTFRPSMTVPFNILLRRPSWTSSMHVKVNGIPQISHTTIPVTHGDAASGFDPRNASFHTLYRNWVAGDEITIEFEMPILARRAHPRVRGHERKAAVTRGPLVYCLESVDNPEVDIFNVPVDLDSLQRMKTKSSLGEIVQIFGKSRDGMPLTFIPYFLWGNRGPSTMTVWVNE